MRQVSEIKNLMWAVVIIAAAFAMGCASSPFRTGKTQSGIRAAEEVGAAQLPQASLHLQLAKEELDLANKLSEKDEKEKAASMLMRADADAELAIMLSHGDAEKVEAEKAMARVRKIRTENP